MGIKVEGIDSAGSFRIVINAIRHLGGIEFGPRIIDVAQEARAIDCDFEDPFREIGLIGSVALVVFLFDCDDNRLFVFG